MLVGVAAAVDVTYIHADGPEPTAARTFTSVVGGCSLTIFTAEVVVKTVACGFQPQRYLTDADDGVYNAVDFGVIVTSFVFISSSDHVTITISRLVPRAVLFHMPAQWVCGGVGHISACRGGSRGVR